MQDSLNREGIGTSCAGNVFQAVSAFTRLPADIVVLGLKDLTERDLMAIRVFQEVRADCFVLVVFPAALRERAVQALSLGADAYVLEPFYPGEFLDIVRRALSRRAHGQENGASNEDLERLAGAVAHSINNPLQILELLIEESQNGAADVSELRGLTRRIKRVVVELLAFARRADCSPVNLDLNDLIRAELPPLLEGRHLELDLAQDLPTVLADRGGMTAVLRAFAEIGAPGVLTVSTRLEREAQKRFSVLCFSAPDLILSPAEREAFFTPFAGPASGEVGLATATAKAVIDGHGGFVEFLSRDGIGTRIVVALPAL
jgi:signal transduction histidine kinase